MAERTSREDAFRDQLSPDERVHLDWVSSMPEELAQAWLVVEIYRMRKDVGKVAQTLINGDAKVADALKAADEKRADAIIVAKGSWVISPTVAAALGAVL